MEFLSEDGSKLVRIPDPYGHKPYFLTDENIEELKEKLSSSDGVEGFEEVEKINPLTMKKIKVVKVDNKRPTSRSRK